MNFLVSLFDDVNDIFLYRYEQWMLDKSLSITSVGIYCRSLRALFNEAIYRKIKEITILPVSKNVKNVKKAFSLADIGKIYYYQPKLDNGIEAKGKAFGCLATCKWYIMASKVLV